MNHVPPPSIRDLRKFAVVLATALVALWVIRGAHRDAALLLPIAGVLLIVLGVCVPARLAALYRWWFVFGAGMGAVVSRILLAVVYVGILTPTALIRRCFHRDPLGLRWEPDRVSYFEPKIINPPKTHERMF